MTFSQYASVILEVAVDKPFDYGVPEEMLGKIRRGMRVEVPVRNSLSPGYVIALKDTAEVARVKPIGKLLSSTELLTEELFELALFVARYYCASLRETLKVLLPASVRKEVQPKQQLFVMRAKTREELRGYCEEIRNKYSTQAAILDVMLQVRKGLLLTELLEEAGVSRSAVDTLAKKGMLLLDIVRIDRSPLVNEEYVLTKNKNLSDDQAKALKKIVASVEETRFETHLLYGVTGSGKTEVYLQAIDKALEMGKGVLMLVPEIALTPQTIDRFRSRFTVPIAILHHRLSDGERFDEWHRILRGEARIVIGARSAVFSPVQNVGLIIVDEEHESSYKQSEKAPCYHARDVAVVRAHLTKSTVILGSATPSLESFANAESGKYTLSILPGRADRSTLPKVTMVDMRREFEKAKGFVLFSDPLLEGIKKRCAVGEQTILFLNRRGYHSSLICKDCGHVVKCIHCDVSLTFHKGDDVLTCHMCGYALKQPPRSCQSCNGETLKYKGVGTEQVEKAIHAVFPEIRTLRIDADTTRHKGSHQKLLREFATGKADVLIGTQMIAKGHHFTEVTLVGVLNSDASLQIPDFRSSETTFQLITQVAGRSGRGMTAGEVIIQTAIPDNSTIKFASEQNYDGFFREEISIREAFLYPPFSKLAKILVTGPESNSARAAAEMVRATLLSSLPATVEFQPVLPSGHVKIKDKFRFQFLIKGERLNGLSKALDLLRQRFPRDHFLLVDIDPVSLL